MNKTQTYLLALLSAFLLWLAWPPMPFTTPLLLIALVPLFIALENISTEKIKKQGKRIFLTAGLTFLIWNTASIYWVYNAISAYNGTVVAIPVSLIPYGLGALLMTFSFWLYYRLSKYTSKNIAYLGLVSFYIGLEYLQQTWDLAFPWMTLGNGLAGMHQLAQWYDYTGVYGGSLWILVSNILAFEAYKKLKTQTGYLRFRTFGFWALIVIIPIGISVIKYLNFEEKGTPSNVVVVQPNNRPCCPPQASRRAPRSRHRHTCQHHSRAMLVPCKCIRMHVHTRMLCLLSVLTVGMHVHTPVVARASRD